MTTLVSQARRELLRKLLERYERSQMYGHPAPWPRDMIVPIDRKEFPAAFAPEGREELSALCQAIRELTRNGAARAVHFRGLPDERPREIRLGPAEVAQAYTAASADGFEPLSIGLQAFADCVRSLADPTLPPWMQAFLARLKAGGGDPVNLPVLGMRREHFKREWRQLVSALTAAAALARGVSGWERVVSEKFFGDSKKLGSMRSTVAQLLTRADPRWEGLEPDDSLDILEAYGVRRKPGLLRCAGAAELRIGERTYFLEDFNPTAHLPEEWAPPWVEGVVAASPAWITTIENEFPFLSYVLEAGGPCGLGKRSEIVIYTAGFPSLILVDTLAGLAQRSPRIGFRHWGDADLGGLRIWWLLRSRLNRPVELFRTRAEWLEEEATRLAQPLTPLETRGLVRLQQELDGSPEVNEPDVAAGRALLIVLLNTGKKVEQERY
jgi:Wadjet anti plasmid transformation system JetA-like protein